MQLQRACQRLPGTTGTLAETARPSSVCEDVHLSRRGFRLGKAFRAAALRHGASAGGRHAQPRRRCGPPMPTGQGTGATTAPHRRSLPAIQKQVPLSAAASCASAPTAPERCPTGPTPASAAGACQERAGPVARLRGIDRRHPAGSKRRHRQPSLTARRRVRRIHPGRHLHGRRRHRNDPLHPRSPATARRP